MIRKRSFIWVALLALTGAGLAAYLTVHYYLVLKGAPISGGPCAAHGTFDCSAAAFSRAGRLFGLPIALYGLLWYLSILGWTLLGAVASEEWRRPALSACWWMALGAVCLDVYLAWVMVGVIGVVCLFCVGTYAVNLLLLIGLSRVLRPLHPGLFLRDAFRLITGGWGSRQASVSWFVAGWLLATSALGLGGGWLIRWLVSGDEAQVRAFLEHSMRGQSPAALEGRDDPQKGPPNAPVQIVKFSDFECPSCRQEAENLRILMARYPDRVSVIYRNYPLDPSCNHFVQSRVHAKACRLALWGECARRMGAFWTYHDVVFRQEKGFTFSDLERSLEGAGVDIARLRECGNGREAWLDLQEDVQEAGRLQVHSTPTLFVNGYRFTGDLTPWVLDILVQILLDRPARPAVVTVPAASLADPPPPPTTLQ